MLANYLIGLREGLETALVVSILIAYLVKVGRRDRIAVAGGGVAAAVAVSVAFGALLTYTSTSLLSDFQSQEVFGGTMSALAVVFVIWMTFWMRRAARGLRSELDVRQQVQGVPRLIRQPPAGRAEATPTASNATVPMGGHVPWRGVDPLREAVCGFQFCGSLSV